MKVLVLFFVQHDIARIQDEVLHHDAFVIPVPALGEKMKQVLASILAEP